MNDTMSLVDTHYDRDEYPHDQLALKFAFGGLSQDSLICSIVVCIIAIVGLIGNALMLRAWIKYPKLRNDFYTVFAALSLVDILFILNCVPMTIIFMMPPLPIINETYCKIGKYLMYASGFISSYLIAVLALLRAILLTNRNMLPRPRAKHLVFVSVFSYIVIFLLSIPIINMFDNKSGYCYYRFGVDTRMQTWLLNSFSAFVPLFLVFLFYLISFILGKRYFADSYSPRERQKSLLVSCVVIAFIICQMPFRVISIYDEYLDFDKDPDGFERVQLIKDYLLCLLLASKAVRPILCSKLTKDLGRAFDEVVNCQDCRKRNDRANDSLVQTQQPQPELQAGADTPIPPANAADKDHVDIDPETDPEPPSPLMDAPPRSRITVDRTISTSSTISSNSQTPLIRYSSSSSPSEMEMV